MSSNYSNPKVSARPPEKRDIHIGKLDDLASAFIREGSIESNRSLPVSEKKIHVYPWENARDDVYKTFNLRLPEELAVKLEYVAMTLRLSKHSVCLNAVKTEIEKLLEKVFKSIEI